MQREGEKHGVGNLAVGQCHWREAACGFEMRIVHQILWAIDGGVGQAVVFKEFGELGGAVAFQSLAQKRNQRGSLAHSVVVR